MNLADAIREAAKNSGKTHLLGLDNEVFHPAVVYHMPTSATRDPLQEESSPEELESVDQPSYLRVELQIPADQIGKVLRSVTSAQHNVLTVREAASHLRLTVQKVEELAQRGELPGVKIDGKWRFSRSQLDHLFDGTHSIQGANS